MLNEKQACHNADWSEKEWTRGVADARESCISSNAQGGRWLGPISESHVLRRSPDFRLRNTLTSDSISPSEYTDDSRCPHPCKASWARDTSTPGAGSEISEGPQCHEAVHDLVVRLLGCTGISRLMCAVRVSSDSHRWKRVYRTASPVCWAMPVFTFPIRR
ncbi:hypothetical protein CBL_06149 [Carabus blaptoides fortunei]